jgi:hypothetical protein
VPHNMHVQYFNPVWTPKPLSCWRIAAGYRLTLGRRVLNGTLRVTGGACMEGIPHSNSDDL